MEDREIRHAELSQRGDHLGIGLVADDVADPDVQWKGTRMIPYVRGVVAGGAGPVDRGRIQGIIEPCNAGDGERVGVEDRLSPGDRLPRLRVRTRVLQVLPRCEE